MLTTKDVKVKDQKDEKLGIITTNKVKPKVFVVKGKPQKAVNAVVTTGNMAEFQALRKEEVKKEKVAAKKRQKKLSEEIKKQKENERQREIKLEGSIEKQIEALDKKRAELEAKLGGKK